MAFFTQPIDTNYEGFYDGQNKFIPDNTELEIDVIDGFVGIEEGKSVQVCLVNVVVTTPGEFCGQKYRYGAKIYDVDAGKRDLAMKNLGVLDAQAGFPMTTNKLDLTTENIQQFWAGRSSARVKFGAFADDDGREINFIRGFAYDRNKMQQPAAQPQTQAHQPAPQAAQAQQQSIAQQQQAIAQQQAALEAQQAQAEPKVPF